MKIIHITTGDLDGIGLEVSLKALSQLAPVKDIHFVLWRATETPRQIFQLINKRFQIVNVPLPSPEKLLKESFWRTKKNPAVLWDMACPPTPTKWVAEAGTLCLKNKKNQALVTGPLSKTQMKKEKFKEKGHTDLLKKLTKSDFVFMTFLGEYFNVALLTGHVPLKKISFEKESLHKCISLCLKFKKKLFTFPNSKPLGVLGLNPHAGEEGLLGKEEILLKTELKKWKKKVKGPLVPDVAFLKENWKKYFMYLCLYHDQALIPFKMIHGKKSFQISLGLPFLRVSVSHGKAQDIFGQNKANADSMKQALSWAIQHLTSPETNGKG